MSAFIPDGYVPTQSAVCKTAQCWFGERLAALETSLSGGLEAEIEPKTDVAALARAVGQASVPDALETTLAPIVDETVYRLRQLLHG